MACTASESATANVPNDIAESSVGTGNVKSLRGSYFRNWFVASAQSARTARDGVALNDTPRSAFACRDGVACRAFRSLGVLEHNRTVCATPETESSKYFWPE